MVAFRSHEHWNNDDVDRLERDAKRYVGKSNVQIAVIERDFATAPPDVKSKNEAMVVKLDEAAAAALSFAQAWHKAFNGIKGNHDVDAWQEDMNAAEVERQKFINATKAWALAAQATTE